MTAPSHADATAEEDYSALLAAVAPADETAEVRVAQLAAWCAENIRNGNPANRGPVHVLRERLGYCGARARMFVELLAAAGLEARVFGIFTPGLRHTVTQVTLGGAPRFVDPQYGCLCQIGGRSVGFEEMCADPVAASAGLVFPRSQRREAGLAEDEVRIAHARRLYSEAQLGKTRSYGFLRDERPVVFPFRCSLADLRDRLTIRGPTDRVAFIEAGEKLQAAPPNFLGATDRVPQHVWELEDAAPGAIYEIGYRLRWFRGTVRLEASGTSVAWLTPTTNEIDGTSTEDTCWPLRFEALGPTPVVTVSAPFEGWGRAALVTEMSVTARPTSV